MAEYMDCSGVFKTINDRQIEALMLHDQMADMFDFLGLMGFKRMHEYQYFSEAAEHRATKRYFINHHNKLIMEGEINNPRIISREWNKYTRFDVDASTRKQSVKSAFEKYKEWEEETKEIYCDCAKALMEMGHVACFNKVNDLICDVDMELKKLHRMMLKLSAVGYDEVYMISIQDELHECYKEKTKEIGIDIC